METGLLWPSRPSFQPQRRARVAPGGWPLSSVLRAQQLLGHTVPLGVAVHVVRSVCGLLTAATDLRSRQSGGRRNYGAVSAHNVMIYEDGSIGLRGAGEAREPTTLDDRPPLGDMGALAALLREMVTGASAEAPTGHAELDALLALMTDGLAANRCGNSAALRVALDRFPVAALGKREVRQFTAELRAAVREAAVATVRAQPTGGVMAARADGSPSWMSRRRLGRALMSGACTIMILVAIPRLEAPAARSAWTGAAQLASDAGATSRLAIAWLLPVMRAHGRQIEEGAARTLALLAHDLDASASRAVARASSPVARASSPVVRAELPIAPPAPPMTSSNVVETMLATATPAATATRSLAERGPRATHPHKRHSVAAKRAQRKSRGRHA